MRSLIVPAMVLLAHAWAAPAAKSALDKAAFADYIRQVELLPATLQMKVGDPQPSLFDGYYEVPVEITTPNGVVPWRYFVSKDGKLIVKGSVFDINQHPFQTELKKLRTDLQPSFGTPGAPVVLVIFSDFQCPKCKEEAQIVRENLMKTFPKEVRVYFKNFPLEQMHPWAKPAAIAGRCVFRQKPAAFWNYHDWIYEHQAEITPENLKTKVEGWAVTNQIDTAKLTACAASPGAAAEVDREVAEGRSLLISGTPTLFVNGRALAGALPWATLEQVIKLELGFEQASKAAGEKCCEVTIPSLAPARN